MRKLTEAAASKATGSASHVLAVSGFPKPKRPSIQTKPTTFFGLFGAQGRVGASPFETWSKLWMRQGVKGIRAQWPLGCTEGVLTMAHLVSAGRVGS